MTYGPELKRQQPLVYENLLTETEEFINIDPHLVKHNIIQNLITNAIKFTADSEQLNIKFLRNENKTEVIIRNYGSFLPLEKREKLFYSRESTTTLGTSGEKGTGLGLTIVKAIADIHKIEILIESEDGIRPWTEFQIIIP